MRHLNTPHCWPWLQLYQPLFFAGVRVNINVEGPWIPSSCGLKAFRVRGRNSESVSRNFRDRRGASLLLFFFWRKLRSEAFDPNFVQNLPFERGSFKGS